jgi:hypothetical protein
MAHRAGKVLYDAIKEAATPAKNIEEIKSLCTEVMLAQRDLEIKLFKLLNKLSAYLQTEIPIEE